MTKKYFDHKKKSLDSNYSTSKSYNYSKNAIKYG